MLDYISQRITHLEERFNKTYQDYKPILKNIRINKNINSFNLGGPNSKSKESIVRDYQIWIRNNESKRGRGGNEREVNGNLKYKPNFTILMSGCRNDNETLFQTSIDSVIKQTYSNWNLYINVSLIEPDVKKSLMSFAREEKIKLDISDRQLSIKNSFKEILKLTNGDYLAFLKPGDTLASFALYEVAKLLNQGYADIIYSDEDKIDSNGNRVLPSFKPSWSPYTLRSYNYIENLLIIRKGIIDKLNEYEPNLSDRKNYELVLRASEKSNKIKNINKILYHSRYYDGPELSNNNIKAGNLNADLKAIQEHCKRLGDDASIYDEEGAVGYRVRYRIIDPPMVSIIIPAKDKVELTRNCINSIIDKSTYKNYEIIIIDNNSVSDSTYKYYGYIGKKHQFINLVEYNEEFNWSKINNFAVKYAAGDVLIFLNNDTEVITNDWIEALIEYATRKDIGVVGALLLYPDKKIQHCGVVLGMNGWADHVCSGLTLKTIKENIYCNLLVHSVRNVSAVTGACLCIENQKFLKIGRFDENFIIGGGDVEFCLRALEHGYFNIYLPHANLIHYESASRKNIDIPPQDYDNSRKAYSKYKFKDPYYSENFDYFSKIPRINNVGNEK